MLQTASQVGQRCRRKKPRLLSKNEDRMRSVKGQSTKFCGRIRVAAACAGSWLAPVHPQPLWLGRDGSCGFTARCTEIAQRLLHPRQALPMLNTFTLLVYVSLQDCLLSTQRPSNACSCPHARDYCSTFLRSPGEHLGFPTPGRCTTNIATRVFPRMTKNSQQRFTLTVQFSCVHIISIIQI